MGLPKRSPRYKVVVSVNLKLWVEGLVNTAVIGERSISPIVVFVPGVRMLGRPATMVSMKGSPTESGVKLNKAVKTSVFDELSVRVS